MTETNDTFWDRAQIHAGVARDQPLPEVWSFGATPHQADELLDLVVAGRKTGTSSALSDYQEDGEDLPTPGLSIIADGAGNPRVLIMTTDVRIMPFGDVDQAHAAAEGERDLSLDSWRAIHREAFAAHGNVTDDFEVVLERFTVVYAE